MVSVYGGIHVCSVYMYIVCHMKLSLHYPQQKAKQEAATDHKDSDVKEGVAEEEGEWVEYVDSFGRTRRCPKEDLPHIQAEEQRRRERSNLRAHQNKIIMVLLNDLLIVLRRSVTPDLLSDDMAMERERRQWERESRPKN